MNLSRFLLILSLVAIVFTSCSGTNKTTSAVSKAKPEAKLFVVTSDSTPFFRHGPQAGRTPDQTLTKETVVALIRPSFGYSKVKIAATGEQGYVSSEDIRPASPSLIASAAAPKIDPLTTPSTQSNVEQFNLNSDDPRLVPPPEALPPTELPAPSPEQ